MTETMGWPMVVSCIILSLPKAVTVSFLKFSVIPALIIEALDIKSGMSESTSSTAMLALHP